MCSLCWTIGNQSGMWQNVYASLCCTGLWFNSFFELLAVLHSAWPAYQKPGLAGCALAYCGKCALRHTQGVVMRVACAQRISLFYCIRGRQQGRAGQRGSRWRAGAIGRNGVTGDISGEIGVMADLNAGDCKCLSPVTGAAAFLAVKTLQRSLGWLGRLGGTGDVNYGPSSGIHGDCVTVWSIVSVAMSSTSNCQPASTQLIAVCRQNYTAPVCSFVVELLVSWSKVISVYSASFLHTYWTFQAMPTKS